MKNLKETQPDSDGDGLLAQVFCIRKHRVLLPCNPLWMKFQSAWYLYG